jgi:hypothetical protein
MKRIGQGSDCGLFKALYPKYLWISVNNIASRCFGKDSNISRTQVKIQILTLASMKMVVLWDAHVVW